MILNLYLQILETRRSPSTSNINNNLINVTVIIILIIFLSDGIKLFYILIKY